MPVKRSTYADLRERFRAVVVEREHLRRNLARLEAELKAERGARRILRRELDEAQEKITQLDGRTRRLDGLLRSAQQDQAAEVVRLGRRLERAVRGCARYRGELVKARQPRPAPSVRRELELLNRRCRELDERLVFLTDQNDRLSRERVDAAGTLVVQRPDGREPGVSAQ
ncbi:hypothetical protein AB0K09_04200 [Streptomyces sp. NPDC049577]|uniref:hypothetical protein n=1 Tax=Streptomyces sp. NPDC049577 TaxID=3155153 RepID=UPI00341A9CAA